MSENLEELLARHFKENTREILDTTREMIQDSERRMVVLMERIRSDVRAVAEGLEMTQQRFELSRAEDRDDIDSLDRRVTRLEARAASAG